MELMAVIRALESLNQPCLVNIYTDSRYVRDAFEKGWIKNWKRNGWKTSLEEAVLNKGLWTRLASLCEVHQCRFHWVKGHSRNKENNRCDELAAAETKRPGLPVDLGYEQPRRVLNFVRPGGRREED